MTLQINEKLTYNGERYELYIEPLRPYLYDIPLNNPVVLILNVRTAGEAM